MIGDWRLLRHQGDILAVGLKAGDCVPVVRFFRHIDDAVDYFLTEYFDVAKYWTAPVDEENDVWHNAAELCRRDEWDQFWMLYHDGVNAYHPWSEDYHSIAGLLATTAAR